MTSTPAPAPPPFPDDLPGAALWYARAGVPVFPCKPGEKVPATRNGVKDATTDEAQVAAWWRATPTANIGMATGRRFDVLDIDGPVSESDAARLNLAELRAHALGRATTAHGGEHLLLPPILGARNRVKIVPHVDYRALDGYVVAPPSRLDDGIQEYRWPVPPAPEDLPAAGTAVAPDAAPDWLRPLGQLVARRVTPPQPVADTPAGPGHTTSYGRAALDGEVAKMRAAGEGTRNATLNVAAFSLGRVVGAGHLDRDDARAALRDAAMSTGLPADEVARTLDSGLPAGEKQPRTVQPLHAVHDAVVLAEPPPADEPANRPAAYHTLAGKNVPSRVNLAKMALAPEADSDVGRARLALVLTQSRGGDLAYSPGRGLMAWDEENGLWSPNGADVVRVALIDLGDHLRRAAAKAFAHVADADVGAQKAAELEAKALLQIAHRCHTAANIDRAVDVMRSITKTVPAGEFDADPDLLAVANGTINLRTGQLRPPDRTDLITQRLTVDYDPAATAPLWEATLRGILVDDTGAPDEPLLSYFQQLLGYGITGHTNEQVLPIWHGVGANGKSLIAGIITDLFAPITRTPSFDTFAASRRDGSAPTPDLASLAGARLVFAGEGDDGLPLAEGVVKKLTGQDMVTARHLNQEPFEYRPHFLLTLVSNHLPQVRGQDEGIWRRIKVVPFRRYFAPDEQDRTLADRLRAEYPGILAWVVRGAMEWYRRGRLDEPASIRRITASYRASSDRVGDFLREAMTITGDTADAITGKDLRQRYVEWCNGQGEKAFGVISFFVKVTASDRRITRDAVADANKQPARFLGLRPKALADDPRWEGARPWEAAQS